VIHGLEHDERIAIGAVEDELAYFSRDSTAATCSDADDNEVWEVVNPSLDRLLGFGRSKINVRALLRRGQQGLSGLHGFLEYLVKERGVGGALLEGKINLLLDAIHQEKPFLPKETM